MPKNCYITAIHMYLIIAAVSACQFYNMCNGAVLGNCSLI